MPTNPLVSIIIVNYNGKQFLNSCLTSVFNQSMDRLHYEVIVVDNDSSDNSVSFIKKHFPDVVLIESQENLGFAGGNNLGVSHAKGEFVALLNNDTKVSSDWLQNLYTTIKNNPRAAAVNAKALLYHPFVQVEIESDSHMMSDFTDTIDFRQVGVAIEEITTPNPQLQRMIQYYQGFYKDKKTIVSPIIIRWTNGKGKLLLAINPDEEKAEYYITVRASKKTSTLVTNLRIKIGDQILVKDVLQAQEVKQFHLSLNPQKLQKFLEYEVQNAGNIIFKSAHSRDRGAVVGNKQQYFEIDNDYFNQAVELQAFCGVSVILRKEVFTKLGGFDESFFMYYEDVDLSIRMRQAGYKLLYEPKAVLYHIHAGSSSEWSPLFIYNVEKNHLAVVAKHFPFQTIVREVANYYGLLLMSFIKMCKWRLSEHWPVFEDWKEKLEIRQNVLSWFWKNWFTFMTFRHRQRKLAKKTMTSLYQEYY